MPQVRRRRRTPEPRGLRSSSNPASQARCWSTTPLLVYDASSRERNHLWVGPDWSDTGESIIGEGAWPPKAFFVNDVLEVAGAGCKRNPGGNADSVRCDLPAEAPPAGVRVYLRDGADEAEVDRRLPGTQIFGGPGGDNLRGQGALHGGPGADQLYGGGRLFGEGGDDYITGGPGNDQVFGGPGVDTLDGNEGRDMVSPGAGGDFVNSGAGNDTIRAADGRRDEIDCGGGRDTVVADGIDWVETFYDPRGCERIRRRSPARALPFNDISAYEGDAFVEVGVGCPPDGPARCVGQFRVVIGHVLLGPERLGLRRGEFAWWEFDLGSRLLARLDGKRMRTTVRSFDRRGVLRRASFAGRFYLVEPGCGDC